MMFKQKLIAAIVFTTSAANAQTNMLHRYKDPVFQEVTISKGLSYDTDTTARNKAHLFDLYQPENDHTALRPLIIWMHGGGFKFGSKNSKGIQIWSKTFAQRGYVCAAVNYRLSSRDPLFNFSELQKSCYYAVQDIRMAIDYFRQHYQQYRIDTTKIILAGNSAGAMIALQTAYSKNADLAKMAGINDTTSNQPGFVKVAGVINFWGAIFDLNWLKNTSVPIVSVLGSNDGVVPPTHKSAPLYGGEDIHKQAEALGIPNKLKVYEGYSHELEKHFNPFIPSGGNTQKRWLEAGEFAADFLYETIFK